MTVPVLNIMIKPASGLCNMRCKYCFYIDETEKRETANFGMMTEDTLRSVIGKTLAHTTKHCTIAFQGGEPTLAGLDFFKAVVHYGEALNVNRCRVSYALQTNGLAIDGEWAAFFAKHKFLVGVSMDGTRAIHDKLRVDASGEGTHARVLAAARLLQKHGVDTNILTVITDDTARHFQQVYNFFVKNGFDYQQYIPCLDPMEALRGQHPWSLTPERFGQYLKTAFDCWHADAAKGQKRYHRYFDNLLLMLNGQPPEACGMGGTCARQYIVEADGSVFPCDFYMLDAYRLGNLNTDTFEAIDAKRTEISFIAQSAQPDEECEACQWRFLCRGGCRRDRDYFDQGIGKNYYCAAYKAFFAYAAPRLTSLYRALTGR